MRVLDYTGPLRSQDRIETSDGFMLFAPRVKDTGQRVQMIIAVDDAAALKDRGRGRKGVVTDVHSGRRWVVYGAPCEFPRCLCDATIVPEAYAPQE
jgi:hypothetical protein